MMFCTLSLIGCSGGEEEESSKKQESSSVQSQNSKQEIEIAGEIFDAGNVQVLVPEGWKAFPVTDAFADDPKTMDPDVVSICKGGETDLDTLTKPSIRIDYYGPDREMMGGLKDWYSNTEDLAPMQLGNYTWTGFTTTDYGKMAVLCAEDGDHQYQATVYLEVEGKTISLEDQDVQAILASVRPSDGSSGGSTSNTNSSSESSSVSQEESVLVTYDWWDGYWYGWWCIKNGTGSYAPASDIAWDAYAQIEVDSDNTGVLTLWDTGTTLDDPLAYGYMIYEAGITDKGRMVTERGTFFPENAWNNGMAAVSSEIGYGEWTVDVADSSVSHFDSLIEIKGHYQDPGNAADSFDYYVYLRPWGLSWDDVRNGDTTGCIYSDMMPLYYDNWYVSLVSLGYERPTNSFAEGIDIIEKAIAGESDAGNGALDPAAKEGATGEVSMEILQKCLPWCKTETSYDTTYEEVAAQFGAHGKSIESLFEGMSIYRWWSAEDIYIQITFKIGDDGTETWNVTQWKGLD